ncbi:hypothetical protein BK816_05975 [Boudabousia tangfeifanii]|uniref:DUF4439 domain-containing protein n=1 Tax=Boudabousia tangfeifanii TaxID=1912795 RepID=A0A1D9MKT8_9ACTO|nr:hypothetical protein [Boudabousia tangfeifanii]AOZ72896.1 hypothetical protein BK816_05975 [Boudabousia tangfeifanii]
MKKNAKNLHRVTRRSLVALTALCFTLGGCALRFDTGPGPLPAINASQTQQVESSLALQGAVNALDYLAQNSAENQQAKAQQAAKVLQSDLSASGGLWAPWASQSTPEGAEVLRAPAVATSTPAELLEQLQGLGAADRNRAILAKNPSLAARLIRNQLDYSEQVENLAAAFNAGTPKLPKDGLSTPWRELTYHWGETPEEPTPELRLTSPQGTVLLEGATAETAPTTSAEATPSPANASPEVSSPEETNTPDGTATATTWLPPLPAKLEPLTAPGGPKVKKNSTVASEQPEVEKWPTPNPETALLTFGACVEQVQTIGAKMQATGDARSLLIKQGQWCERKATQLLSQGAKDQRPASYPLPSPVKGLEGIKASLGGLYLQLLTLELNNFLAADETDRDKLANELEQLRQNAHLLGVSGPVLAALNQRS